MFFEMLNDVESCVNRTGNSPKEIVAGWTKALSPIIPHVCEELWNKLGNKNFASREPWPVFDKRKIDKNILELENIFKKTQEDLNQVLKLAGKKKNAYLYFVTDKELDYFEESLKYLKNLFAFKKMELYKVSDKNKYDPEGKSSRAKYGKPAIYLE